MSILNTHSYPWCAPPPMSTCLLYICISIPPSSFPQRWGWGGNTFADRKAIMAPGRGIVKSICFLMDLSSLVFCCELDTSGSVSPTSRKKHPKQTENELPSGLLSVGPKGGEHGRGGLWPTWRRVKGSPCRAGVPRQHGVVTQWHGRALFPQSCLRPSHKHSGVKRAVLLFRRIRVQRCSS